MAWNTVYQTYGAIQPSDHGQVHWGFSSEPSIGSNRQCLVDVRLPIALLPKSIHSGIKVGLQSSNNPRVILRHGFPLVPQKQTAKGLVERHDLLGALLQQGALISVVALPSLGLALLGHARGMVSKFIQRNIDGPGEVCSPWSSIGRPCSDCRAQARVSCPQSYRNGCRGGQTSFC